LTQNRISEFQQAYVRPEILQFGDYKVAPQRVTLLKIPHLKHQYQIVFLRYSAIVQGMLECWQGSFRLLNSTGISGLFDPRAFAAARAPLTNDRTTADAYLSTERVNYLNKFCSPHLSPAM